jgi:methylisocitrate lyase
MAAKIRAAKDAKEDPDFIVIARTDNYEGIEELIRRGKIYAEAGADMLYPVGSLAEDDFKRISEEVPLPLMDTPLGGGKSPIFSLAESETYNIKLSVYSLDPFAVAYCNLRDFLGQLKTLSSDKKSVLPLELGIPAMEDFYRICDLERTEESVNKYFN